MEAMAGARCRPSEPYVAGGSAQPRVRLPVVGKHDARHPDAERFVRSRAPLDDWLSSLCLLYARTVCHGANRCREALARLTPKSAAHLTRQANSDETELVGLYANDSSCPRSDHRM